MTKLHRGVLQNNTDVLTPKTFSSEPSQREDGSSLQSGDLAYSDGTSSTNNFGVDGPGIYENISGSWRKVSGNAPFIDGGVIAADVINNEITVKKGRRYTLTASDTIAAVIGLADGEFCQLIAPASGSTTLQDEGDATSGQSLKLSGADLVIQSTDETVYTITRAGSNIRVSGGSGGSIDTVDSIAALTALSTSSVIDGDLRYLNVAGREGLLIWDSSDLSTEVGYETSSYVGVFYAPDSDATGASGAWVRQAYLNNGEVNARWCGCVGDNSTNDSAPASAALNLSVSLGVWCFFPKGQYLASGLPVQDGLRVRGAGRHSGVMTGTLFKPATNSTNIFEYTSAASNVREIHFKDFSLSGNGVAGSKGFFADTNYYAVRGLFENMEVYSNLLYAFHGNFIFTKWKNITFGNSGNRVSGEGNIGIFSTGADGSDTNNNVVEFCQFQNDYKQYMHWQKGRLLKILDCDFEGLSNNETDSALLFEGMASVTIDGMWLERIERANLINLITHSASSRDCTNFIVRNSYFNLSTSLVNNAYIVKVGDANQEASMHNLEFWSIPSGCNLTDASIRPLVGAIREVSGSSFSDSTKVLPEVWKVQFLSLTPNAGFSGAPTFGMYFSVSGGVGNVSFNTQTATSNASTFTFAAGSIPAPFAPSTQQTVPVITREGSNYDWGKCTIASDGSITITKNAAGGGFATSGDKGIVSSSGSYRL